MPQSRRRLIFAKRSMSSRFRKGTFVVRSLGLALACCLLGFAGSKTKASSDDGPIRMEALDPNQDPPTFVMRGGPRGPGRMVFLHGMCGHGLGYAQAFQFAAAKKGMLIAPQGDRKCGDGPWAAWSNDLDLLDERIVNAFRATGDTGSIDDIVIMGYSHGALRAESLARKWPQSYTRPVLMGSPRVPSPKGLSSLRAA